MFGCFKRMGEQRALNRCLEGLAELRTLCDAPSGPGRLFSYWKTKGFQVTAVELSEPMAEAAKREGLRLDLKGSVLHGDVFALGDLLEEKADIVASIRFIYYFNTERRIALLRTLSTSSQRYVLVQYKTMETLKGRLKCTYGRRKERHQYHKEFCSYSQIAQELEGAGLTCLRIEPISRFSDRVFVLAENPRSSRPPLSSSEKT